MAKSKARRGSTDTGIPTDPVVAPPAPPDPALQIIGSFVAHYTAQGGSGTAWMPQSTIVEALFDRFGAVHGIIHRNPGGTAISTIKFRGTYGLQHDTDLGTISGLANFDLLNAAGDAFRRQELYIVKRNASEVFFMLGRSFNVVTVYPPDILHKPHIYYQPVDTGASVEGVFYKAG